MGSKQSSGLVAGGMTGALASRQLFAQFEGLRLSTPAGSLQPCSRVPLPAPQRRCRLAVQARQYEVGVGLFGTKAGMTQIFVENGEKALPATVIALEPGNIVAQVKTAATDGYNSVQVRSAAPPLLSAAATATAASRIAPGAARSDPQSTWKVLGGGVPSTRGAAALLGGFAGIASVPPTMHGLIRRSATVSSGTTN